MPPTRIVFTPSVYRGTRSGKEAEGGEKSLHAPGAFAGSRLGTRVDTSGGRMIHFRRGEAIREDAMICPNCKRDAKTETTTGVLKYRNRYWKEIPVPRFGERCLECGHLFNTMMQEENHIRERDRMIKESEQTK